MEPLHVRVQTTTKEKGREAWLSTSPSKVQDRSWCNKLLVEVQAVLLVRQMSHLQNINKANVSTKVLKQTYIRSYHTCICIKKVMWGLVAASQLLLSGYPVLWQWETSLRWGSAHESTNHHINTLLWIHPRLSYEKAIHSTHTCLEHFRVSTLSCLCTT